MRKTFKKLIATTLACAMVCTISPLTASATVGSLPANGSIDGDSDIVGLDTEVYDVIVPTTIDFAADPQGLLSFAESGTYDPDKAGNIISGDCFVINKSSMPITVALTPTVKPTATGVQSITLVSDPTAVKAATGPAFDLALQLVPTASVGYKTSGSSITVDPSKATYSNTGFPITKLETDVATANKIEFQMEKAEYLPIYDGAPSGADGKPTSSDFTYELVESLDTPPDAIGFKIAGSINQYADWVGEFSKMGVAVKYSFANIASYNENASFTFGSPAVESDAHGILSYVTSTGLDAKSSVVEAYDDSSSGAVFYLDDRKPLIFSTENAASTVSTVKLVKPDGTESPIAATNMFVLNKDNSTVTISASAAFWAVTELDNTYSFKITYANAKEDIFKVNVALTSGTGLYSKTAPADVSFSTANAASTVSSVVLIKPDGSRSNVAAIDKFRLNSATGKITLDGSAAFWGVTTSGSVVQYEITYANLAKDTFKVYIK